VDRELTRFELQMKINNKD